MRHGKKIGGALLVASVLAGFGTALSYLNTPGGAHPSSLGHTTTCEAQVKSAQAALGGGVRLETVLLDH